MYVHDNGKRQKSLDDCFRDFEHRVFGFGYKTGEMPVLTALKTFMSHVGAGRESPTSYDYQVLEKALTPTVAWLLINTLCKKDFIEYGTSPRFGWLTAKGVALKRYVDSRTEEQLYDAACGMYVDPEFDYQCDERHCECVPQFLDMDCENPFLHDKHARVTDNDPRWNGPLDIPEAPKVD